MDCGADLSVEELVRLGQLSKIVRGPYVSAYRALKKMRRLAIPF